jgi:hypothetical protein
MVIPKKKKESPEDEEIKEKLRKLKKIRKSVLKDFPSGSKATKLKLM